MTNLKKQDKCNHHKT